MRITFRLFLWALGACIFISPLFSQQVGETFDPTGEISVEQLLTEVKKHKKLETKLTGTVNAVCQKKGCWLELPRPDEGTIRVTFKDYAFFVPKDISGKTVVLNGFAFFKETSIEQLRHYAKDAGKSASEIEAINTPKKELCFEAKGVIIK